MHSDVIQTIIIDVINDMFCTDVLFCRCMCDFDPGTHTVIFIQFLSLKLDVTNLSYFIRFKSNVKKRMTKHNETGRA